MQSNRKVRKNKSEHEHKAAWGGKESGSKTSKDQSFGFRFRAVAEERALFRFRFKRCYCGIELPVKTALGAAPPNKNKTH